MLITACIYHSEVVFPERDEIVNGRFVRRVPRRLPPVVMEMPTDPLTYQVPSVKIAIHSRPIVVFGFDDFCGWDIHKKRDHVRRVLLGRTEVRFRFKLHELEADVKAAVEKLSEAERGLKDFEEKDDNGYFVDLGWSPIRRIKEHVRLKDVVRKREWEAGSALGVLEEFKTRYLPMIWPINRKNKENAK